MQPPYPPQGPGSHPYPQSPSQYPPGHSQYPQGPYPPQQPRPKSSGAAGWLVGLVVLLFGGVMLLGILSVLAIYGMRRYLSNAKRAEATNALGMMGRDAVAAYEEEQMAAPLHVLCKSSTTMVPVGGAKDVAGKKYMSATSEWTRDPKDTGFTCLKFEMATPQYYAYGYKAIASELHAIAEGDLDGDGAPSRLELEGRVNAATSTVMLSPTLRETDPDE